MIASRSLWGICRCIDETVKLAVRICCASHSTYTTFSEMRMGKVDIVTLTYLGWCVTEDDGLRYGKRVVKVAQRVKLPVFLFNSDEEFLEAFHHQFILISP